MAEVFLAMVILNIKFFHCNRMGAPPMAFTRFLPIFALVFWHISLSFCGILAGEARAASPQADVSASSGTEERDAPANASAEAYVMPSVTITADKRPTEVQRTPMAVTVLTEQKLDDAGVNTVDDVFKMVPNVVNFKALGEGSFMSFRGAITSLGTKTSPLVMYVDGVPVDTYFNLDANPTDIERVDVLRGAQSTMYGNNALGCFINSLSKKPTTEYQGKISVSGEAHGPSAARPTGRGPL